MLQGAGTASRKKPDEDDFRNEILGMKGLAPSVSISPGLNGAVLAFPRRAY
jgi:hypothetical protein